MQVTTLRTVYIHTYGIINLLTLEVYKRPIKLYSVQLCNISASHARDNVYRVEIPRIIKKCNLYYEFFFIENSYEVSLAEDTIYSTTIDTESNLSISIIAILLIIPAALLLTWRKYEYLSDSLLYALFILAIVVGVAISLPPLFIHLGFRLATLIFDLVVIL